MNYGILSVQFHTERRQFVRHWVTLPSGDALIFNNLEYASDCAARLQVAARGEGILNQGYRARSFDLQYAPLIHRGTR